MPDKSIDEFYQWLEKVKAKEDPDFDMNRRINVIHAVFPSFPDSLDLHRSVLQAGYSLVPNAHRGDKCSSCGEDLGPLAFVVGTWQDHYMPEWWCWGCVRR